MGGTAVPAGVALEEVESAWRRISPWVRRTPTIEVRLVEGRSVQLKLEVLQLTGTFKARGAFNSLLSLPIPDSGVIAASGGNHGIAVAFAAAALGIRCEIFVPQNTPPAKIERLRASGAAVTQVGSQYAEALAAMRERMAATRALEIHAYDAPSVVAGQGSLSLEFLSQCPELQTLVIAVGGGGLIAGALAATRGSKRIIAVEPRYSAALNAALSAGEPVDVEVSGIAADSLGARRIGSICFGLANAYDATSVLVEDEEIRKAQAWLWRECRQIAEPGGAAALAAVLFDKVDRHPGERVGVVVCGANTDPSKVPLA